jgi:hypothetical protein
MLGKGANLLAGVATPQDRRLVKRASHSARTISTESHAYHCVTVPMQGEMLFAGTDIPKYGRTITVADQDSPTIAGKCYTTHRVWMFGERLDDFTSPGVPQNRRFVPRTGQSAISIARDSDA